MISNDVYEHMYLFSLFLFPHLKEFLTIVSSNVSLYSLFHKRNLNPFSYSL